MSRSGRNCCWTGSNANGISARSASCVSELSPNPNAIGIAGKPPFLPRRVAIDEGRDGGVLPLGRDRPDAVGHDDAAGAQCRHVPQALGEGAPAAQQSGHGATFCGEGGGVEHGGDPATRLGVLVGDEVEQRSGAHEDDSRADGAALVLQGDLRAAQRVDAGKRPARKRDDPVARTGRQDDVAIRDLPTSPAGETVQRTVPADPRRGYPAGSRCCL